MKNILYIAVFLLPSMLLAQDFFDERWFFQASAHLNIPRKEKATYTYGVHFIDHLGRDASYGKEHKFKEKVIHPFFCCRRYCGDSPFQSSRNHCLKSRNRC